MRTKVKVTRADIRAAKKAMAHGQRRARCCPISQATCRAFPEVSDVCTGLTRLVIGSLLFLMPKKAQQFVDRFDSDRTVKPFSFYVRH